MSYDQRLITEAEKLLKLPTSLAISKSTRSGASTSITIAAQRLNRKLVVVSPTKKILHDTISVVSDMVEIPGNENCKIIQNRVGNDALLKELPIPLPNCKKCKEADTCCVRKILRVPDWKTAGLTYKKLVSIMLSKSSLAKDILNELRKADTILLDEAHILMFTATANVEVGIDPIIPKRYKTLAYIKKIFAESCMDNVEIIDELLTRGNRAHIGNHLSRWVVNNKQISFEEVVGAWDQLIELAISRHKYDIGDLDILALRDMVAIMSSASLHFAYIREDDVGKVHVYATTDLERRVIREFMRTTTSQHIYSSATLVEPEKGFFSDMSGQIVEEAIFYDHRQTNAMMTIIPDRYKLRNVSLKEKLQEISDRIREILQVEKRPCFILSTRSRDARIIFTKLREDLPQELLDLIEVDYYRSANTIGVPRNERVCIAVGLAEVPSNAYDAMVHGDTEYDRWIASQRLRHLSIQTATWQAWSRVKDPNGKDPSMVYCIGIREKQAEEIITWGTKRDLKLIRVKELRNINSRQAIFGVVVENKIEPPTLLSSKRKTEDTMKQPEAKDYIKSIKKLDIDIYRQLSKNPTCTEVPYIYNVWENCAGGIFRLSSTDIEKRIKANMENYHTFFINRYDVFAMQQNNPAMPWVSLRFPLTEKTIHDHCTGDQTIGCYQLDKNNLVKWGVFDIDDHTGDKDAMGDCKKMIQVLRSHDIPFLLEGSGSPNSYHIWLFFWPTMAVDAKNFMLALQREAGIDCEIFPKQTVLDKKGPGNQVKLPICLSKKSGRPSMLLDPDGFTQLAYNKIEAIIELRHIDPIVRQHRAKSVTPQTVGRHLLPCQLDIIKENVQLTEGDGHYMRVAIASNAIRDGLSIDEIVDLFRGQQDFDEDYTRNKIETDLMKRKYWVGCNKLKERCNRLVKDRCTNCPYHEAS